MPPLIPTYYHWETVLAPTPQQRALLVGHDRLYVKVFDVSWEAGAAVPAAEKMLVDTVGLPPLTPVIFITNEVLQRTSATGISALARQLVEHTENILPTTFPELQLDCDWTAGTKERYFALIRAIKDLRPGRSVTCTIRLHQYRDRSAQGTPPADRGTLMAYNTGALGEWATENSIIDAAALHNYLGDQPAYPLPLDIAVAAYDWALVFRRGELIQLINEPDLIQLADTSLFVPLSLTRYQVKKGNYLNGTYLYPDDLLRYEIARPEAIDSTAKAVRAFIGGGAGQRLLVFRLGARVLE